MIARDEIPGLFVGVPALRTNPVGRNEQISGLVGRLVSGASRYLALEGQPGVGKTTMALVLAHHRRVLSHFRDGVLWASLGPSDQADPMRTLGAWAAGLGQDISGLLDLEEQQEAVKTLIGQRCLLLVIDDAWDLDMAQALRCGGPSCCHLLTTRDRGIARSYARAEWAESVLCLDDDWAYELLRQWAPEACETGPTAARALARAVGGLPLALELLGSYLAAPERSIFTDLSAAALAEMADPKRRLQLAQKRLGARGRKVTLQETIALSLEGLPQETVAAFYALGAFAPRPERFSREAAEAVTQAGAQVLAVLAARNLMEVEGESLALHQTLADVARTGSGDYARARHREYCLTLANEDRKDWQRIEAAYGQIKWAWLQSPADVSRLDWAYALRIYQGRRGLWRDQIAWIEAGLEVIRAEGRRQDEGTLLNNIGSVYARLGQRDKALDYYQRALPIMEEVGDRAGLATTLNNIGSVYSRFGQRDKALDYYQRALPIMEEVGDRAGLATTLNNIGSVYDSLGQGDKALDYYQRALPIREEVGDRAGLATTLNNIGSVYARLGQRDKALDYYQRALPIREEVGDRAGLATTLNNIGLVYDSLGQRDKALDYYQRALPIMEEVGDRAGLATTLNNIGSVYDSLGQGDKALDYYQRALPIMEEVGDRAGLATTLNNIGLVYDSLGQGDKALDYYQRALPITEEVGDRYGESITRYNIATVFRRQGRLAEAVVELERVLELDRLVQHPDLEDDMAMLAQVKAELAEKKGGLRRFFEQ